MYDLSKLIDKYILATEIVQKDRPQRGFCGLEIEWNLLDAQFNPVLKIGSGSNQRSFVDYLRQVCLPDWIRDFSQLEVFHWMIEWATRPYFSARGAVFEGRMMEGALINSLKEASKNIHENYSAWSGNLPLSIEVGHDSIPETWHLAKRLYLERCVDLYGENLATAGTHSNLSLPDPLFSWDFMHLPEINRSQSSSQFVYLDEYKSQFYITAARLMRAFASLFIACSASTPFKSVYRDGRTQVLLTGNDSVRNLTFPNPENLDLPYLYRSYEDYLRLSNDLVRRGIRFGNNNWTPVRARSFAEPVERVISITSEQLEHLYAKGLFGADQGLEVEEVARRIEIENLLARINIPMSRVEVRTDDGGHRLDVDIANLTLKQLLLLRIYGDNEFGRAFRYDTEDIQRARRNEERAAQYGLRAEIDNPFTGKPVEMRAFLSWTLKQIQPMAEALQLWGDLDPLVQMSLGDQNSAEILRNRVMKVANKSWEGEFEVPLEIINTLVGERVEQVKKEIASIVCEKNLPNSDQLKLDEFIQHSQTVVYNDPDVPVRFQEPTGNRLDISFSDNTAEIIDLARQLIQIPSVTACQNERLDEVRRAAVLIYDYARQNDLSVRFFHEGKYPGLLIDFPGSTNAPVMLCGHFDVVAPDPDDGQFEPKVDGDYLWGRGAADMKSVVATYLVWMKNMRKLKQPYPRINLLLVGNEENGESDPMGTPHILNYLYQESGYQPELLIAGERTGEKGDELWGEICVKNRGIMRMEIRAAGERGHTGLAASKAGLPRDLTERILDAKEKINQIATDCLTLKSQDGWQSQLKFPFIRIGEPGMFNVSADMGVLGVEIRSIPEDNLTLIRDKLSQYAVEADLYVHIPVMEAGIACPGDNPHLAALVQAVKNVSSKEPAIGNKLPGTSARFSPGGNGVVWGESGIGPHSRNERHFIPSIAPYYDALTEFGKILQIKIQ